ncbi:hypothetical protein [Methylotuvimicrobium sp. KM1]|uniref:hypothetical protein n=1 Tax=Methylotuvimicrobium sp. KM1 TaxID=3377707 RepID=UPI00384BD406
MLAAEDIEYIKTHLAVWLAEQSLGKPPVVYEIELRERMVRVEEALKNQGEELKAQRETMMMIMQQMDKRFEQVDKRLEQMQQETNKRFEQMQQDNNKRFEQVHQEILQLHRDMRQLTMWAMGIFLSVAGLAVAVFRLI